jgi:hypothetical protein
LKHLPDGLNEILPKEIYARQNRKEVQDAIDSLGVKTPNSFSEFYSHYVGPFWEESVPFELLELAQEQNTIVSYTLISRKEHELPNRYLVLSEMTANAVLMYDTNTDKVYNVNFEGGDELLTKGELKEDWSSFYDFLIDYFGL